MKPADDLWMDLPWLRDDEHAGTKRDEDVLKAALTMAERLESDDPLDTLLGGVEGRRVFTVTEGGRRTLLVAMHEDVHGLREARELEHGMTADPSSPQGMPLRRLVASLLRKAAAAPFSSGGWRTDDVQLLAGAIAAGMDDEACSRGIRVTTRFATPLLPAVGVYQKKGRSNVNVSLPTCQGGVVFLTGIDGCVQLNENGSSIPFGPFDAMERLRMELAVAALPPAVVIR
jgi:hypothetical protein